MNSKRFVTMRPAFSVDEADLKLRYWPQFLTAAEQDFYFEALRSEVNWQQGEIQLFGKTLAEPRLSAWYGERAYRYAHRVLTPQPWLPRLWVLKQRIESLLEFSFNSVLLNYYRNGHDSMGMHADDEPELGAEPAIASLSLGQPRKFVLQHKQDKQKRELTLEGGSLLCMDGATQAYWKHGIPKQKKLQAPRINLTFRFICKQD